jgi:hypothetical protein
MRGTGIEKEVEIFCYKHNQQKPSARASLQRIGKICEDI